MSYLRASRVKSYTATVVVVLHWYRGESTDLCLPSMADIGASASNSTVATSQVGTQPSSAGGDLFAIPANSDMPELPPPDEPFGSLDLDDMDIDIPAVPAPEQAGSANAGEEGHGGQQEPAPAAQVAEGIQQGVQPPGEGAQGQPGPDGNADMRAAIAKLAQVSTALVELQQGRAARPALRVSDVKLKEFSGHADAGAHCIDTEQFLPLLRWLQDCRARLATYKFAESDKVTLLVSSLSGGARAAFNDMYADAQVCEWSLEDAFGKIAALVPDHSVLFTKRALDMKFAAGTLHDNVKTFELYMRFGDMQADGSQFVWSELQNKMLAACPDLFAVAASKHNLHFQWDATKSFAAHVAQALKIVSVMQIMGDIGHKIRSAQAALQAADGSKRQKRPLNPHRVDAPAMKKPGGASQSKDNKAMSLLARELGLCYKCTQHCPNGHAIREHKASCAGSAEVFRKNMQIVRKLHAEGEEGLRKIKSRKPVLPGSQ